MATIVFVNGTGVRGNGCDYMGGQTGLAADSGGDLMSAWDPDKLEKRVTEVADEVGKLAEGLLILPVSWTRHWRQGSWRSLRPCRRRRT
jgi:hypothetical protein